MTLTLSEVLDVCPDWEGFCDKYGFDHYAVNEGGGDITVSMSIADAQELGIVTSGSLSD